MVDAIFSSVYYTYSQNTRQVVKSEKKKKIQSGPSNPMLLLPSYTMKYWKSLNCHSGF